MRVAFYAPLKPPGAATPSGDRQMARMVIRALEAGGNEVEIASVFRSRDGAGDSARQQRLKALGGRLAERIIRRYARRRPGLRPDAWFTYHLYHKAPDWIGPAVCAALAIPYVVAEASFAPKQEGGRWSIGHAAVRDALRRADAVVALNSHDTACVEPLLKTPGRMTVVAPFTDIAPFARAADAAAAHRAAVARAFGLDAETPMLLAVAMMRDGDKLASYRILAAALAKLTDLSWRLVVVGDGAAGPAVREALAPLGADRVRYAGQHPPEALPAFYAAADLLLWPAIREAYGVALLEAQATGLAVVAGESGGVGDIVRHGETGILAPEGDPAAFADAVRSLLAAPERRAGLGRKARAVMARGHSIEAAASAIDAALRAALAEPRGHVAPVCAR